MRRALALGLALALVPACSLARDGRAPPAMDDAGIEEIDAFVPEETDAGADAPVPPVDAPADAPRVDGAGCAGPELCNGIDDDCDPLTADGTGDPTIGDPCDGLDADMCTDGVYRCTTAGRVCSDDGTSSNETCNGMDDDCDSMIDEGFGPERCNGMDDDCDSVVDEVAAVDAPTWYPDADRDGWGTSAGSARACTRPTGWADRGGDCNDLSASVSPGATETCNGADDDCDTVRDERPVCGNCDPREYGGHLYQLCRPSATFDDAAVACAASGYYLAAIENMAENVWLYGEAFPITGRYWIGVRQGSGANWIRVVDGALQSYRPWRPGEPNDGGTFGGPEDCVDVGFYPMSAEWNDSPCGDALGWVCERAITP
jgi:hypothetical protein